MRNGGAAAAQLVQDVPTVIVPPEPPITTAQSVFTRSRDVGVADRMLPAFTAQGTTVGAFDVFAGLSIGGSIRPTCSPTTSTGAVISPPLSDRN
ncbi:hypothetical protein P0F65_10115 [Sphingomonas sp. I4]